MDVVLTAQADIDRGAATSPGALPGTAVREVADLSVSSRTDSGWTQVVHDVSFAVGRGETVALVGESGSGKSVTALSVMGLNDAATSRVRGTIRLAGQDLLSLSKKRMCAVRGRDVAMIFQEPMTSLNPVHTIGTQIAEALATHRRLTAAEARSEALRLLERVRIPAARSRFSDYPHQFSGGMRQRVMIAMALACRPNLLIADEPTTALDVTIQAQILDLIRELQAEEGMSVLFITHDMGVVAEIADRVIVMYDGRVVETEETGALFRGAAHPYSRVLLAAVPRLGAMAGRDAPLRFPVIDRTSGQPKPPVESAQTVDPAVPPLLEVRGLTTRFGIRGGLLGRVNGRIHAVENLSFDLRPGETLALVGESGCGKSTTGRSLLRLIEPDDGSVLLEGTDLLRLSKAAMRARRHQMQMIFQDPFASLNPRLTVGASIQQPMVVNGVGTPRDRADRIAARLEQVGLTPDMAARFPHEFSGGQRQRLCIARALAVEPKLIVADEAVSALDVSVKAQVVNLMLDLQEQLGLAYVFISHDMSVVERVCHRVAVMYLGEIVEIGPRADVFANPQHPYTRRLLSAVPVADPARRGERTRPETRDIKSPIRPVDYRPPAREWREVAHGHRVMIAHDED